MGLFVARRLNAVRRRSTRFEPLEDRRLLALDVTQVNLAEFQVSGGYAFTDSERISVAPGVVVNSAGGTISFEAPVITIGEGAQLIATGTGTGPDGAISLTAANQSSTFPLSLIDQFYANVASAAGRTASIDVKPGAIIRGGKVTLDVVSGEVASKWLAGVTGKYGEQIEKKGDELDKILELPISIIVKQPESLLTLARDVSITGSGDVTLASRAGAEADGQAGLALVQKLTKAKENPGSFGFAAGVSYTDVRSGVSVAQSAVVRSTRGNVSITSDIVNSTTMVTPSPNPEPGLVRESSCLDRGWKGFSDEEATQCRADRGLAQAG